MPTEPLPGNPTYWTRSRPAVLLGCATVAAIAALSACYPTASVSPVAADQAFGSRGPTPAWSSTTTPSTTADAAPGPNDAAGPQGVAARPEASRRRGSSSSRSVRPPVASPARSGCDANYSGCVPVARDVDCEGGNGNGPEYVAGPIRVLKDDVYDLDRDGDGLACEPEPTAKAARTPAPRPTTTRTKPESTVKSTPPAPTGTSETSTSTSDRPTTSRTTAPSTNETDEEPPTSSLD